MSLTSSHQLLRLRLRAVYEYTVGGFDGLVDGWAYHHQDHGLFVEPCIQKLADLERGEVRVDPEG